MTPKYKFGDYVIVDRQPHDQLDRYGMVLCAELKSKTVIEEEHYNYRILIAGEGSRVNSFKIIERTEAALLLWPVGRALNLIVQVTVEEENFGKCIFDAIEKGRQQFTELIRQEVETQFKAIRPSDDQLQKLGLAVWQMVHQGEKPDANIPE